MDNRRGDRIVSLSQGIFQINQNQTLKAPSTHLNGSVAPLYSYQVCNRGVLPKLLLSPSLGCENHHKKRYEYNCEAVLLWAQQFDVCNLLLTHHCRHRHSSFFLLIPRVPYLLPIPHLLLPHIHLWPAVHFHSFYHSVSTSKPFQLSRLWPIGVWRLHSVKDNQVKTVTETVERHRIIHRWSRYNQWQMSYDYETFFIENSACINKSVIVTNLTHSGWLPSYCQNTCCCCNAG